ncbi:response regulator transcription factor [Jatrophihabitans sp.]|uniref:winged helix-turn-helix domain-containing protein n=1 Tax=Jatrophihabitans sp. TaxID=1932789 RepID=UPI0030C775EF|nr:response regulator transcription factor [Jatrophihabitans sp.]
MSDAVSLGAPDTPGEPELLEVGDVVLNRAAFRVTVAGRSLALARQEFRLLELLMSNADRVLTSSAILDAVWGPTFTGDPGTLAVHMLRLRNKLEREPGGLQHLRTVRGVGYIFDTDPV